VALGEALWDLFPGRRSPGGAPCNVAFHAARLGNRGVIVTRVGRDAAGADLVGFLRAQGVDTSFVQHDLERPTGTADVTLATSDPSFTIADDVAWDYLAATTETRALARLADAVCVGSLAQRGVDSRAAIQQLLADARSRAIIVFDVNLRPPFVDARVIDATLRVVDVVKMNASEVGELSTLLGRPALVAWLLGDVGVDAVCVTRGREGASMTTQAGMVSVPGVNIDSTDGDPVGAGDAFAAALMHQLLRQAPPDQVVSLANRYAALVASKRGAMPVVSSDELAAIGWGGAVA